MAEGKEQQVFDSYETIGIVIPGASLLFALWLLLPHTLPRGTELKDISLGSLGFFAIAAFCVGHLIQSPANLIETFVWKTIGRPTEHMRREGTGLSEGQRALIPEKVRSVLGFEPPQDDGGDETWQPVIRSMASAVASAGCAQRLEKFNATYGLHRGLATAMLIAAFVACALGKWPLALLSIVAFALALARALRFANHYASALWTEFLQLPVAEQKQ